jgi:hypothetical protein
LLNIVNTVFVRRAEFHSVVSVGWFLKRSTCIKRVLRGEVSCVVRSSVPASFHIAPHTAFGPARLPAEYCNTATRRAPTRAVIHRDLIITLAGRYKLPAIYFQRLFVAGGGLISCEPDFVDH